MTFEEFDVYQEELLAQVVGMKNTKGREYANSTSRFANFTRLEDRLDMDRLKVAYTYLAKHLDSIENYIKTKRQGGVEPIQGRIVDAITYLTLIGGMIEENEVMMEQANRLGAQQEKPIIEEMYEFICSHCAGVIRAPVIFKKLAPDGFVICDKCIRPEKP